MPATACLGQNPYCMLMPAGAFAREGTGSVELPPALEHGYESAAFDWVWPCVLPPTRPSTVSASGRRRRPRPHESAPQDAVRRAALRARIVKSARCWLGGTDASVRDHSRLSAARTDNQLQCTGYSTQGHEGNPCTTST
jgi:hypothetical protein